MVARITPEEQSASQALLADLVRIPSINPRHQPLSEPPYGEAAIGRFLAERAAELGAHVETQEVLPHRRNVHCHWGDPDKPHLILETHLDTVAADERGALLRPRVRGHRLYGRGACDAKGSLAAMLIGCGQAAPGLKRGGVLLAAVVDEEHGFRGAQALVARALAPALVIVGEPTALRPVVATKGCLRFAVTVRGKSGHTSAPGAGVNAVVKACQVISELQSRLFPLLAAKTHPLTGPATAAVTIIRGGTEVNVVPEQCSFHVDRRVIPGESAAQALQEITDFLQSLAARDPDLDITAEPPYLEDPPLAQSTDVAAVKTFLRLCQRLTGNGTPVGVPFGTDASKFARAGLPSLVFGPGNVAQAHADNEWVDIREVVLASHVYAQAALSLQP